jgi:transposase
LVIVSATILDDFYRAEKDADVRERLLLIRRIKLDNKEAASVAENEFHRSRWWAYKWLKRFNKGGFEGLKDKHRTGRPPKISENAFTKIKGELSQNPAGWKVKQIMNIIYEKTGVR